jgi:hypothetical protein
MLRMNGTRQPHDMKASGETDAFTIRNARFARITPAGAPTCAKLP